MWRRRVALLGVGALLALVVVLTPILRSPAVADEALWRAGMEQGSLAEWTSPAATRADDAGGGEYDSGEGFASVTSQQRRSGTYAARLELPHGNGGTRLFRWRELREHRDVAVSVWLYFPSAYTVVGRYFNIFQFKSRTPSNAVDPIWYLDVQNPAPRRMRLDLIWWHRSLQGPWRGQSGFKRFTQKAADVPVGRWFQIRAELRQSSAFDGALRVWQDGTLLFDMTAIRTSYDNCEFNAWCTSNEWSVNDYSDGLRPRPAVIYADDAEIDALSPAARRRHRP